MAVRYDTDFHLWFCRFLPVSMVNRELWPAHALICHLRY